MIINIGLKSGPTWWPTLNWAHPLFMGCAADVTCHVTCQVDCHVAYHVSITFHVIAMSVAMSLTTSIDTSSLLSTSSQSHQPTSYATSSMHDMAIEFVTKIILFVMFIFVIESGLELGFGAQGHFMTVLKRHGSSNL